MVGDIIGQISSGTKGDFAYGRKAYLSRSFSDIVYKRWRKTKRFSLDDGCTGCGLCASKCPAKAIEIIDGRPVWTKDSCYLCLRCLHHCPAFAIQYGDGKTREHGQYRNPYTKV